MPRTFIELLPEQDAEPDGAPEVKVAHEAAPEDAPAQPDLRPRPSLDMQAVAEAVAAGRTPTCPDCGEALTRVPRADSRMPRGWEPPRPEDHRCDPDRLARLRRARSFQTRPGESPAEARIREAAERETFTRPDQQESELF